MVGPRAKAFAYSKDQNEANTQESTAEELILLLLAKTCERIKRASLIVSSDSFNSPELEIRLKSVEDFYTSCAKALEILMALRGLIDLDRGGELAVQLQTTYSALISSLNNARKTKSIEDLDKIHLAVSELREGWEVVANRPVEMAS